MVLYPRKHLPQRCAVYNLFSDCQFLAPPLFKMMPWCLPLHYCGWGLFCTVNWIELHSKGQILNSIIPMSIWSKIWLSAFTGHQILCYSFICCYAQSAEDNKTIQVILYCRRLEDDGAILGQLLQFQNFLFHIGMKQKLSKFSQNRILLKWMILA